MQNSDKMIILIVVFVLTILAFLILNDKDKNDIFIFTNSDTKTIMRIEVPKINNKNNDKLQSKFDFKAFIGSDTAYDCKVQNDTIEQNYCYQLIKNIDNNLAKTILNYLKIENFTDLNK